MLLGSIFSFTSKKLQKNSNMHYRTLCCTIGKSIKKGVTINYVLLEQRYIYFASKKPWLTVNGVRKQPKIDWMKSIAAL